MIPLAALNIIGYAITALLICIVAGIYKPLKEEDF